MVNDPVQLKYRIGPLRYVPKIAETIELIMSLLEEFGLRDWAKGPWWVWFSPPLFGFASTFHGGSPRSSF